MFSSTYIHYLWKHIWNTALSLSSICPSTFGQKCYTCICLSSVKTWECTILSNNIFLFSRALHCIYPCHSPTKLPKRIFIHSWILVLLFTGHSRFTTYWSNRRVCVKEAWCCTKECLLHKLQITTQFSSICKTGISLFPLSGCSTGQGIGWKP